MTAETRVGVWVDNGKVFWRTSDKEYSAKVATPLRDELLPQVLAKVRVLYDASTMSSWTASAEAAWDQTFQELQALVVPIK